MVAQVRRVLCWVAMLWLVACSPSHPVMRYVLIAPFEGEEREVGYQMLYGARLAIAEANRLDIELLAVDDGGSHEQFQQRLLALERDPNVIHILLGGTHSATVVPSPSQHRIGRWNKASDEPCGDLCTLIFFRAQLINGETVTVETTSPPIDEAFRVAYLASDQFVPEPLPLAQATYQTVHALLHDQPLPSQIYRYDITADSVQTK
ncbi:MAG: hypothetical protein ACOYLB_12975 [Phototrophicaceae bacterium]